MGRVIVGLLLVASIATNIVLLVREPDSRDSADLAPAPEPRTGTAAPAPARAEAWSRTPVNDGGTELAERITLLEQRLAEAEKEAARFRSIDPVIVAIYSSLPLRDKLLAIADLDD